MLENGHLTYLELKTLQPPVIPLNPFLESHKNGPLEILYERMNITGSFQIMRSLRTYGIFPKPEDPSETLGSSEPLNPRDSSKHPGSLRSQKILPALRDPSKRFGFLRTPGIR